MTHVDKNHKGKFIGYATFKVMSIREIIGTILILIGMIIVMYYSVYFFIANSILSFILFFIFTLGTIFCLVLEINSGYRPKLKIFNNGFQIYTNTENAFFLKPWAEIFISYSEIKNIYISKHRDINNLVIKTSSEKYMVRNIDNEKENIEKIKNNLNKYIQD